MFASSEVWLIQSVGGIQPAPDSKGFSHVLVKPSPPTQLESATTSYDTVRGRIGTEWNKGSAGKITLNVVVPPNVKVCAISIEKNSRNSELWANCQK